MLRAYSVRPRITRGAPSFSLAFLGALAVQNPLALDQCQTVARRSRKLGARTVGGMSREPVPMRSE